MARTLFSLMLDEDVVREVDALAHRMGTNRSNLINRILAQYVDYETPEQRIQNVFAAIEALMRPSRELVPLFTQGAKSVSVRSALDYKYRPTVTYEVTLTPGEPETLGALEVCFRTRSAELLARMTSFFTGWARLETDELLSVLGKAPRATLTDGKFTRPLLRPRGDFTAEALAGAITDYVKLFDGAMKASVAGAADVALREAYRHHLEKAELIV